MNEFQVMIRELRKKSSLSEDDFQKIVSSVKQPFDRVKVMNES